MCLAFGDDAVTLIGALNGSVYLCHKRECVGEVENAHAVSSVSFKSLLIVINSSNVQTYAADSEIHFKKFTLNTQIRIGGSAELKILEMD